MGATRIYKASPRRRTVLFGCWAIITLFLVIPGLAFREPALLITAGLVTAIMAPMFYLTMRAARLIVSDEGIEVRQLGATLKTPWSNIVGMRQVRGSEGFILREPMEGRGAERVADTAQVMVYGASLYDQDRRELLAEQRFIPIEAFAYWLKHGDLRQAIAERAPQLLSTERTESDATPDARQQRPKALAIALTIVIIVLAGAGGLVIATLSPDRAATAVRILEAPISIVLVFLSAVNFVSTMRRFRARRYASALLWGSLALVQALIALAVFGHLIAPDG